MFNEIKRVVSVGVFTCFVISAFAAHKAIEVAVFAGVGARSNGCVEWFRLVNSSPEMNLTLLDANDIRSGALKNVDLLVMPGGSSATIKKDLKPEGAEKLKDFIRNGGGYIGTCAGCCLMMEEQADVTRGISVMPYGRLGSKGKFMMPLAVNKKGAEAMGVEEGEYKVRYSGGPVLYPTTNVIEGANFEVWATYASDFDTPKNKLVMNGNAAIVGGTYGKGRVFAIACHPENFPVTHFLVRAAFRYVTGREVTFPPRFRANRALTVGFFSQVIQGKEVAKTIVALDNLREVDLFPIAEYEIDTGMLDHIDWFVLPDGTAKRYKSTYVKKTDFIKGFISRGGRIAAWGEGVKHLPKDGKACNSGDDLVRFFEAESQKR